MPLAYVSPGESIELVINVALNLFALIESGAHLCSEPRQSADELVQVTVGVVIRPEGLSVVGVVAAVVTLLCSIVDNWYALCVQQNNYLDCT